MLARLLATTFGMYLQGNGGTFILILRKTRAGDNLVAYQGFAGRTIKVNGTPTAWDANSLCAWLGGFGSFLSDHDYQDMVLLVSQIIPALPVAGATPVPEAKSLIAGLLLLLPLGASTIRILRKNRAV